MSADMIQGGILLFLYVTWGPLALVGWVLPLTDGARRFTFRFLAWSAFCGIQLVVMTPWDWWSILNFAIAGWAIYRIGFWWNETERCRKVGLR